MHTNEQLLSAGMTEYEEALGDYTELLRQPNFNVMQTSATDEDISRLYIPEPNPYRIQDNSLTLSRQADNAYLLVMSSRSNPSARIRTTQTTWNESQSTTLAKDTQGNIIRINCEEQERLLKIHTGLAVAIFRSPYPVCNLEKIAEDKQTILEQLAREDLPRNARKNLEKRLKETYIK